jgi:hypothetical protein
MLFSSVFYFRIFIGRLESLGFSEKWEFLNIYNVRYGIQLQIVTVSSSDYLLTFYKLSLGWFRGPFNDHVSTQKLLMV